MIPHEETPVVTARPTNTLRYKLLLQLVQPGVTITITAVAIEEVMVEASRSTNTVRTKLMLQLVLLVNIAIRDVAIVEAIWLLV